MLQPNLQITLFNYSKVEALEIAKTSESLASQWFKQNYLSFDIAKKEQLQNSELLELSFISKLFKSTLSLETLNQLLLQLQKPYAYECQNLYYDIFSNKWCFLPEEVDEEKVANNYLESLSAEDDREEIESIIENLQEIIS